MSYFIKTKEDNLVNALMIQNIIIDPSNENNLLWLLKGGNYITEEFESVEEVSTRLGELKQQLLAIGSGSSSKEVEQLREQVVVLNEQVAQQTETIEEQAATITTQAETIDYATIETMKILGDYDEGEQ